MLIAGIIISSLSIGISIATIIINAPMYREMEKSLEEIERRCEKMTHNEGK